MNNWSRKEIKRKAKSRLSLNYWKMVFVALITTVIVKGLAGMYQSISHDEIVPPSARAEVASLSDVVYSTPSSVLMAVGIVTVLVVITLALVVCVVKFFLINPVEVGCDRFFNRNIEQKADVKEVFYLYDNGYLNGVKILFLKDLYIFLWTLVLIVPGIVKAYEYRMVPYILAENPDTDAKEAFAMSKEMMKGQKMSAFIFDLSFILWDILGLLTLGIVSVLFVNPYKKQADACLYQVLKAA